MTIREPWAVYELDGGSGVDAVGNGPTLDVNNSGTGRLGEGASSVSNSSPPDVTAILVSDWSFGFWFDVQAGDFAWVGPGLVGLFLDDGSTGFFNFDIGADGTDIVLYLNPNSVSTKNATATGLSAGWHHFALSRTGNSTQFFVDGVAVGAASDVSIDANTAGAVESIQTSESPGRFDQPVFADVAYTADDWAYIVNGGSGRLYANWEIEGGGGGSSNQNFLTMGCG